MRYTLSILFCLLLSLNTFSQTEISGVINIYAVANNYDECSNLLSLDDAPEFEVDTKVIIIQMQGAIINTADNSSFGNITAIGQAGKYELAEILSINGNSIVLKNLLANTYDFSGNVQVVSLPTYESAHAIGELTAPAWDGQTGGVFAIEVTGQMIMEAGIDVSGKGFRGGLSQIGGTNDCSFLTNANDYSYGLNNWRGAPKGEGIAIISNGKEAGRGAQANGGGGGNDHNSGGGGGGNITSGGQGGNNNEPSFFGCDGTFPGLGSKVITQNAGRIFMGGGGGAGHENNNVGTDGGNGGGIVFVIANDFIGLGNSIKANGDAAATTAGDGAGGGGGAGSIVFMIESGSGFHFEANGGNGGMADNGDQARCHGPGGGGSGGRIFTQLPIPIPAPDYAGGDAGISINSSECNDGTNGAISGENGSTEILDSLNSGNIPFLATAIVSQSNFIEGCEGDSIIFLMETEGFDLNYQWQINDGSGFENIPNIPPFSGANTAEFQIEGLSNSMDGYQFRLMLSNDCFADVISEPILLQVSPLAIAGFSFTQNDLTAIFNNSSTGGTTYFWNFGDNVSDTSENPEHSYASIGTYTVQLISSNICGQDTTTSEITFTAPVVADFSYTAVGGCAPFEVQFSNQSVGTYEQLLWEFPGGNPSTSSAETPVIIYEIPGHYDVILTASGSGGSNTNTTVNLVEILPIPTPSFSWELLDLLTVSFTNTSQNAQSYVWNFGDGETSMALNPVHEYPVPGDYQVTLNAQNAYCGLANSENIFLTTAVDNPAVTQVQVFPNPTTDILYVKPAQKGHFSIEIINLEGKRIFQKHFFGDGEIDFSAFTRGIYFLRYVSDEGEWGFKVVKI